MNSSLKDSYENCERIARASGSNFYRSFSLLRPEKRRAMTALYAYARILDDLGDEPLDTRQDQKSFQSKSLHAWIDGLRTNESETVNYVSNELQSIRLALRNSIDTFNIPLLRFHEMIQGVEMDQVEHVRIADRTALDAYCYLVASSVGLACISIWHSEILSAEKAAIDCGIAFQLTNILRDVAEDAKKDRIYLPEDSLRQHSIELDAWLSCKPNGDWQVMLRAEIERSKKLYVSGWGVFESLDDDGQRMFSLMWHTYHRLLLNIETHLDEIWSRRIRLGRIEKLKLYFQHAITPTYLRLNGNGHSNERGGNAFRG